MTAAPASASASAPAAPASVLAPYVLPQLPWAYDAFEPVIDAATMRLHHDMHHQAYVDNVNAALARHPQWLGLTIEEVLRRLPELPDDIRSTVRNQGGGHANHQFFWKIITPPSPQRPGQPAGALAAAIDRDFGSFDALKAAFEEAGTRHFGAGWAFLVCKPQQGFRLGVLALPNQDSVLEQPEPSFGLLCCDLWEHAYYLNYQNRRAAWLRAFWSIVHWDHVGERYAGVMAGRKQL